MKKEIDLYLKFILLLAAICAIIPHTVLLLLRMDGISADVSPVRAERYANFFVCQWIPFWLTFLSYIRVQKKDDVSLISAGSAAVILLTYLPVFSQRSVAAMLFTLPLILLIELSGLLKKAEFSGNKVLAGIAVDRGILRAFCYWSVVFLCVVLISCEACTYERTVVSPFQMLPVPGILLIAVFRHQKKRPPTLVCIVIMLTIIPLSLYLATVGPMEQFKVYHLMSMCVGYAVLFLMLTVYNIDRWKK